MNPVKITIATIDGAKKIVVNDTTILPLEQAEQQLAALRQQIGVELPARMAALNAAQLLARAQADIDGQIARATEAADRLDAALAQLRPTAAKAKK